MTFLFSLRALELPPCQIRSPRTKAGFAQLLPLESGLSLAGSSLEVLRPFSASSSKHPRFAAFAWLLCSDLAVSHDLVGLLRLEPSPDFPG